eukprot:RCo019506
MFRNFKGGSSSEEPPGPPSAEVRTLCAIFEAYKEHVRELQFWKDSGARTVPQSTLQNLNTLDKEFQHMFFMLRSEKDKKNAVDHWNAFITLKLQGDDLAQQLSRSLRGMISPMFAAELDTEEGERQAQEVQLQSMDPVRALQPVREHVEMMMQEFAAVQAVMNSLLVEQGERLDEAEDNVEGAEARVSDGVRQVQETLA